MRKKYSKYQDYPPKIVRRISRNDQDILPRSRHLFSTAEPTTAGNKTNVMKGGENARRDIERLTLSLTTRDIGKAVEFQAKKQHKPHNLAILRMNLIWNSVV